MKANYVVTSISTGPFSLVTPQIPRLELQAISDVTSQAGEDATLLEIGYGTFALVVQIEADCTKTCYVIARLAEGDATRVSKTSGAGSRRQCHQ